MQIGVITLFPHLMLCEDGEKAEQMKKGYFFYQTVKEAETVDFYITNYQITAIG